jgi:hypothetical protein
MPKGVLVVFSTPNGSAKEAEYNDWYDNTHIPEVTDVPGVVSARRFALSDTQVVPGASVDRLPYLAIYELDTDDLEWLAKELPARAADGRFNMSDAIQMDPPPTSVLFEER